MQHYTTAPPAAAPGLDLFAAAWLERWLHHGGSLTVNPDGTGHMFARVSSSDSPNHEPLPDNASDSYRDFVEGQFNGRTRELMDLLELVPGGREAVKAHVRAFPSFAYKGGTVGVI